jgi:predicted metal-dependent hydrolase
MNDQVAYGSTTIDYAIERRTRKTLAIEVHPDSRVLVKAPQETPLEVIRERVMKRGGWILKQQRTYAQYPPPLPERAFVSGETYRYLGKQYRLKVQYGHEERVRLWQGRLEVNTPELANAKKIRRLVRLWLRAHAERVLAERYGACVQAVRVHGIHHDSGFSLLSMPSRWGSCTKAGKLLLNPNLIGAPKTCIDYVITHELCHTAEHNHSPRFYALISKCMPDWEARRDYLNTKIEALNV